MVVLAVFHDPVLGEGDVQYQDGRLTEGRDLETAVYLSLFTDAPAKPGDDVPSGTPHRGFWADAFDDSGDVWGSRLWLLGRAKLTPLAVARAREYVVEALGWLVRDGLARRVDAEVTPIELGVGMRGLDIVPIVYAPSGAEPRRLGPWRQLLGL